MIKDKNYKQYERKLIKQLGELHDVTPEDASMIVGINRRKCKGKPFETATELRWYRFGPTPIFVQNGRYHNQLHTVDASKPYWVVLYNADTARFAVSNKLA